MEKIKAGIVGGTGYTAGELLRILLHHPNVEVAYAISQSLEGEYIVETHKDLVGETNLKFQSFPTEADVIFLCLPHGESKNWLAENQAKIKETTKIIDLGNDFRVDDEWNGKKFVYGLCEFYREDIKKANYIANPGCFATAIQLGILPLLQLQDAQEIACVGITGSTGAGKSLQQTSHFSWRNDNISPYKTFTHQHLGEINKSIGEIAGKKTEINFVPWRGDFTRGIFVSLIAKTTLSEDAIVQHFRRVYQDSPFVYYSEIPMDMKQIVNTNKALVHIEKNNEQLAIHVAIDNLLKGASGQAVQNMNLMFGFEETAGLHLKASVF